MFFLIPVNYEDEGDLEIKFCIPLTKINLT